jgi:hypothetical protein
MLAHAPPDKKAKTKAKAEAERAHARPAKNKSEGIKHYQQNIKHVKRQNIKPFFCAIFCFRSVHVPSMPADISITRRQTKAARNYSRSKCYLLFVLNML